MGCFPSLCCSSAHPTIHPSIHPKKLHSVPTPTIQPHKCHPSPKISLIYVTCIQPLNFHAILISTARPNLYIQAPRTPFNHKIHHSNCNTPSTPKPPSTPQSSTQTQSLQPTQHFYPAPNLHRDCRSFMQPPDLPVAPKILHPAPQNPSSGLHNLHRAHKLSSISSFITKRGKSALLPFLSLLLPHTALPRTDFLFSPSLWLIPMSWSYLDQSRSIYAQ